MFVNFIFYLFVQFILIKFNNCNIVFLDDDLHDGDTCLFNQTTNGICSEHCLTSKYLDNEFPKLCSIKNNTVLYCCIDNKIQASSPSTMQPSSFRRLEQQLKKDYMFRTRINGESIYISEDFEECIYTEKIIGVCRLQCPKLNFTNYQPIIAEKKACAQKYGVPFECCINHLQIAYEPELFNLNNTYKEGDFCPYDRTYIGICKNFCIENEVILDSSRFNSRNAICNHQSDGTPLYCCNDYFTSSGIAEKVVPFAKPGDHCKHQKSKDGICELTCRKEEKLRRFGITLNMCLNEEGTPPLYCCPSLNYADELMKYKNVSSGRTYYKKCQEYKKRQAIKIEHTENKFRSSGTVLVYEISQGDGNATLSAIVSPAGGLPIKYGNFPHMAAIGWTLWNGDIEFKCGGTLISDDFVVTAAHCTIYNNFQPDIIRIGDQFLGKTEDPDNLPQNFGIYSIVKHPNYRHSSSYNDIALIQLYGRIIPTPIVHPACLWNDNDDIDDELPSTAMGYGSTEFGGADTGELLYITLQRVEQDECIKAYRNYPIQSRLQYGILDTQICAKDPQGIQDTCTGDSGGPLEYTINGVYYVYGITSFGVNCPASIPSVYTKISKYLNWIESIVWPTFDQFN